MRDMFLQVAEVVRVAVSDSRVADAWNEDSVLHEQTVGCLTAHLARGAVLTASDYLSDDPAGTEVDFTSTAHYFAKLMDQVTKEDHAAIRARSAELAKAGPAAIADEQSSRLDQLETQLPTEPADRSLAVYGGLVISLDDYLGTRVIEQVVHLDDLARSLDIEPWEIPPAAAKFVIDCEAEIGRLRHGDVAMTRGLFRDGFSSAVPVI